MLNFANEKTNNTGFISFLDDIVPSGAARRYWINFLGLQRPTHAEQDSILLEKGGIAPVGNLRIKEALPPINPESTLHLSYFSQADVAIEMLISLNMRSKWVLLVVVQQGRVVKPLRSD